MELVNKIISKLISGAICAIVSGLLVYMDYVQRGQLGKDAFLAKQAARYDKYFAHPEPIIINIITSLILFCILFAIYEAMGFVIFKILEKINPSEREGYTS